MVIVLNGSERRKHSDYFDQLFRLRHQIFVKQRGWPLPSVNSFEIEPGRNIVVAGSTR